MKYLGFALIPLLAACSPDTGQHGAQPSIEASGQQQKEAHRASQPIAITIDFASPEPPHGVAEIGGMSDAEPWGRWSVEERVRIRFDQPLPHRFVLDFTAHAFGPNVKSPIIVRAGGEQKSFTATDTDQTFRLSFETSEPTYAIEFTGLQPTSPISMGISDDPRTLGVGIVKLTVEPVSEAR